MAEAGHECVLYASHAPGLAREEHNGFYSIVRAGSELTCRLHAAAWLWKRRDAFDIVIDEVNTLPFFSPWIAKDKVILLMHQLAREVWWKEAPRWLAPIGYALEPLALSIYRTTPFITVSSSSLASLRAIGLRGPGTIVENALPEPKAFHDAGGSGVIGYVGRLTPSKRVEDVIAAFERVHRVMARARLVIVGGGRSDYVAYLVELAAKLGISSDVDFTGFVDGETRDRLMSGFDCLLMASLREGWGLVVSEAACFGVPSVAYDVAGLRDSIRNETTGLLVPDGDVDALARGALRYLCDSELRGTHGAAAARMLTEYGMGRFRRQVNVVFSAETHNPS